jgi:uncharacterized protein
MVDYRGRFVWYELTTMDMEAAKAFYTKVVGWGTQDVSTPGSAYTLFTAGNATVGGLTTLPEDARRAGAKPIWIGYVGVDDVDAVADRIVKFGGSIHVPPMDIPNISRLSVVADPQMAAFALLRWQNPGPEQPPMLDGPGGVCWHELFAGDWEKAFAFYHEVFGWQKADAGTGALGTYQMFSAGGDVVGGMFTKPPTVPIPFWLFHFDVREIDAAVERALAAGGKVLDKPVEVPGGWVARCIDPQGAMFALMGKRSNKAVGYFERTTPRDPSDPKSRRWNW